MDALDGAPGVHSARYCGWHGDDAANNRVLMENMKDIPMPERTAQFVCAMALSTPFGKTRVVTGACPGLVTTEPRGNRDFGYDPYFEYLDGRTFSEMPDEEKNKISHRARAMQQMLPILKEEL